MNAKPCPVCGLDDLAIEEGPEGWHVTCDECFAEGPAAPTEELAYALWDEMPRPTIQ